MAAHHNSRLSRQATIHTISLVALLAASSAPTPIYRLYQQSWGFSALVLTTVFATYALSLLLALLVLGRLSDHIGRKPVILSAMALQTGAMVMFILAQNPAWLIAARLLQGIATGIATAALSAALLDIDRPRGALVNSITPMLGMAVGALGSGTLLLVAADPLHLVFYLLAGIFVCQAILTWRCNETTTPSPGAWQSLRPSMTIPKQARQAVLSVSPLVLSGWALGGFYLSLMPSLLNQISGTPSPWLGGVAVALLTMTGAISILASRNAAPRLGLAIGALSMTCGPAVTLWGINTNTITLMLAGAVVTGTGFGAGFLGALRIVMPLARANERAGLTAAFYAQCYLANALPVMLAGYAAQHVGLVTTANAYLATIILLCLAGGFLVGTGRIPTGQPHE